MTSNVYSIVSVICFCALVQADISHFPAHTFDDYTQQKQSYPVVLTSPLTALPSLYASSQSVKVPSSSTHATVARTVPSSSTEYTVPEIVENRSERTRPIVVINPPDTHPSAQASANTKPIVLQQPAPNCGGGHGYDYRVPLAPPFYLPPEARTLDSAVSGNNIRLRVYKMRCMQHAGGYFRATLKVDNFLGATPTVDNDSSDKRCELKLERSIVGVDIAEEDFGMCGVQECGKYLCLRLRFPNIRGIRTSADGIVKLHCKRQERVAVKTYALKMRVSNKIQMRALGNYAHGGPQLPLRTHVQLLRRTANDFTTQLDGHSAGFLGEELLLGAHVIAGDGWKYSKLTDVHLQRIARSGELLNSVVLITSNGCLNPSMKSLCSKVPSYDPPLGHRLAFKAGLFQDMRKGEEFVLSLRISACLEERDCYLDASNCNVAGNLRRRKRNVTNATRVSDRAIINFPDPPNKKDDTATKIADVVEAVADVVDAVTKYIPGPIALVVRIGANIVSYAAKAFKWIWSWFS